jgi:hypothetical protein
MRAPASCTGKAASGSLLADMGIHFWRFRSQTPVTRDPERMTAMVERLVRVGVLTPEEGRLLASDIFNREFRKIGDDWVKRPITLTLAGIQTGVEDLRARTGRRMSQTTVNLLAHVLPPQSLRQWVLTLPFELRAPLAYQPGLMRALARVFADSLLRWYARRLAPTSLPAQGYVLCPPLARRVGSWPGRRLQLRTSMSAPSPQRGFPSNHHTPTKVEPLRVSGSSSQRCIQSHPSRTSDRYDSPGLCRGGQQA